MTNQVEVFVLVIWFSLDGAVVASLLVPEAVIVVGHDVGEVEQVAQLLDVVGGLSDLVHVAGQRCAQEEVLRFECCFQFLEKKQQLLEQLQLLMVPKQLAK